MSRPDNPFEAASYDLKQFRERRLAERRAVPRDGVDRRAAWNGHGQRQPAPVVVLPPVSE